VSQTTALMGKTAYFSIPFGHMEKMGTGSKPITGFCDVGGSPSFRKERYKKMNIRTLVIALAAGMLAATSAQAGLGWTMDECRQHYGDATKYEGHSRPCYAFTARGFTIAVWFLDDKVSRIVYQKLDSGIGISGGEIVVLLQANVPGDVSWSDPTKDDQGMIWYEGLQNSKPVFSAACQPTDKSLGIFTAADNDFVHQQDQKKPKTCKKDTK
jgi:hypothetical protein